MRSSENSRALFIAMLMMIVLTTQAWPVGPSAATETTPRSDLTDISVKVMLSSNLAYGSAFALHDMFEWMNATVDYIYADDVNSTTLLDCDILAAPGGSEFTYSTMLGTEGREAIVNFVSSGGSYFGICGGARLGTNYYLGLFDGSTHRPVPGIESGTYMIQLAVNQSCSGPDLSDQPENITTLYWESAYLDTDNWTGIHPITTYLSGEYSPMVAFQYQMGSVFLSSPHPEYEEDSDRDGTDAFEQFDDPDSEWDLLLKVACWLVDVSPGNPTDTTTTTVPDDTSMTPIVVGAATGVLALVVVVIVKRRH